MILPASISSSSSPSSSQSGPIIHGGNSNGGNNESKLSTQSSSPSNASNGNGNSNDSIAENQTTPTNNNIMNGNSNGNSISYHHNNHHDNSLSIPSNQSTNHSSTITVDCAGCGLIIMDRYYLSAVDQHWHVNCLKCSQCKVNLQGEPSCFSRDGLIFCKSDYYRLFTMRRCSRCGEGIYASELVMRVREHNIYHMQCFTCAWCNIPLSQGDLFGIKDNLVYCRSHYEMILSSNSNNNHGHHNHHQSSLTHHLNHNSPSPYHHHIHQNNNNHHHGASGGTLLLSASSSCSASSSSSTTSTPNNHSQLYSLSSSTPSPLSSGSSLSLMAPSDGLHRHHHSHHHLNTPPAQMNSSHSHHHPAQQSPQHYHLHGHGRSSSLSPPAGSHPLTLPPNVPSQSAPLMMHSHHPTGHDSLLSSLGGNSMSDNCISTLAATPYTTSTPTHGSGGLYSPLSIANLSVSGSTPMNGSSGQISLSNTSNNGTTNEPNSHHNQLNGKVGTGPSIRKGRPRKRKNMVNNHHHGQTHHHHSPHHQPQVQQPQDETINSCSLGSPLSPSSRNNNHSPNVVPNALDAGPLSGLAASIENSCNSQLGGAASALNLAAHQQQSGGNGGSERRTGESGSNNGNGSGTSNGGGQRTKRMRTSFKHHQLRTMKTYFSVNQNPDAKDLKQLAQKTGLSKRVLQVWFQNARAKWRRNNLKMLPDAADGLSLNGQAMLTLGHPSTPSTVIGSPSGSTRPYSSPSPTMSPSTNETVSLSSHQPLVVVAPQQSQPTPGSLGLHSQQQTGTAVASLPPPPPPPPNSTASLEAFISGCTKPSVATNLMPMNFQELY